MRKRLLLITVLVIMAFCLCACGASDEGTAEPAAEESEAPFTFENGVFTCQTFSATVPDGWCIDQYADEDSVKFMNAADEESYDVFTNASVEISVDAYAFLPPDAVVTKDSTIENDKQFFVDSNPEISDYAVDVYSGSLLKGESFSYKGCTNEYYIMDSWVEGTEDCSIAHIKVSYYTEEEKAVVDEIVASMVYTPGGEDDGAAEAAADSEKSIDEEYFSIELPADWYLDPERSEGEIKVKCSRMESGYVTVDAYTTGDDAATWAEKYNGNFGGDNTIETYEYNGTTYKGINPDSMSVLVADGSGEGITIHVKTMFCMLPDIEDLMEAITVK